MTPGFEKTPMARPSQEVRLEFSTNPVQRDEFIIEQVGHPIDQAREAQAREVAIRNIDHSLHTLRQVEIALRRLAGGDNGICANCEDPIALNRLLATPWVRRCVRCQEIADRQDDAYCGSNAPRHPSNAGRTQGLPWSPPDNLTAA